MIVLLYDEYLCQYVPTVIISHFSYNDSYMRELNLADTIKCYCYNI